jgi:hypothetical protein
MIEKFYFDTSRVLKRGDNEARIRIMYRMSEYILKNVLDKDKKKMTINQDKKSVAAA